MRSLQDYRSIYREIADNLNLQGASVDLLIQFLSQASYISEVENVSYVEESSLEKATLMNSKIEHCMNEMYSVFRGSCPRVIMKIKAKKYFTFSPFEEIVKSNSFKIYYLGYCKDDSTRVIPGEGSIAIEEGFVYGPISIPEGSEYTIIGLLASETVEPEWKLSADNTLFVESVESGLSNDMWVKVDGKYYDATRNFSDHVQYGKIFDLTIPDFGSRLYVSNIMKDDKGEYITTPENTEIEAQYFKLSSISDYNSSELKKISIKGTDLVKFDEETFLNPRGYVEYCPGVILIDSVKPDTIATIHYKANRDRYVNSILRSNSDIGVDLQEMYPEKVAIGGTSYNFQVQDDESSLLTIFYVPINPSNRLTSDEISAYVDSRKAYYVTKNIKVQTGINYTALFNIDLELYQSGVEEVELEVKSILKSYGNKFGVLLNEAEDDIVSLISKIPNVKRIKAFSILYIDEAGYQKEEGDVYRDIDQTYFTISWSLNSSVTTTNI